MRVCNALVTAESNVYFGCFCLIILFDRAVSTVPIAMPSDKLKISRQVFIP